MKTEQEIWAEIHFALFNTSKSVLTDTADYKVLAYVKALLWVIGK